MPSQFYEDMGQRIYTLRKRLCLTQDELAVKAGISHQVCSTAERGVKAIRADNIVKIAKALEVSTDYLMTGESSGTDAHYMISKLSNLNQNDLLRISGIIDLFISMQST